MLIYSSNEAMHCYIYHLDKISQQNVSTLFTWFQVYQISCLRYQLTDQN